MSVVDHGTAIQQIDVIVEQSGVEAARILFDLSDEDLKQIRRLNERLAAAKQT